MRLVVAALTCAVAASAGCGPSRQPIEAWDMTIKQISACSVVGEGQRNCTPEDELARRTKTGRWIVEHVPNESFAVTLENGAVFSGIYFNDDGATLTTATPPCFGQGGVCYFARERSLTQDENDNGCGRLGEHTVIMRLTEADGERTLEGVVRDYSLVDANCQAPAETELIHAALGSYDAQADSLAQREALE